MENPIIQLAIERFIKVAQARINDDYATNYKNLTAPTLKVVGGKRYTKISRFKMIDGKSTEDCVWAFVDNKEGSVGDIYKPASYKAPAKHKRGNVFNDDSGASALDPRGSIVYLR